MGFNITIQTISIHAPRVGSDIKSPQKIGNHLDFNPRSPCGERQKLWKDCWQDWKFQSTLPVWGATQPKQAYDQETQISIHAPRVGSDVTIKAVFNGQNGFQSTLPVWGATAILEGDCSPSDISIHAPRVGSDFHSNYYHSGRAISIHAPRVGSDDKPRLLSTVGKISIHAPRVGSDEHGEGLVDFGHDFNPRSPCGERRRNQAQKTCRGQISIHAPRVGSDFE